tara:strand:- start:49 stop:630 length:582 start_codon:yes stop_codon:yes gene_type:complete
MSSYDHLVNQSTNLFEKKYSHIEFNKYLLVSPNDQILLYIADKKIIKNYSISTSKFGLGNINDSFQTPTGLHCIEEKIGDGMPIYTVFRGRKTLENNLTLQDLYNNKKVYNNHFKDHEDVITSRILRLKGLEPSINSGGDVDSYLRYIYIHGTAHEDQIGEKASHGCIRMKNIDIIDLYDISSEQMIVLILNN